MKKKECEEKDNTTTILWISFVLLSFIIGMWADNYFSLNGRGGYYDQVCKDKFGSDFYAFDSENFMNYPIDSGYETLWIGCAREGVNKETLQALSSYERNK